MEQLQPKQLLVLSGRDHRCRIKDLETRPDVASKITPGPITTSPDIEASADDYKRQLALEGGVLANQPRLGCHSWTINPSHQVQQSWPRKVVSLGEESHAEGPLRSGDRRLT
jgi:hypothetical protein